ncbi:MAG: hypothetical protein E7673_05520 [Ruminococcaceae bacterium]|nr:hypothetical protein [Oscillospiraceae bacterium]
MKEKEHLEALYDFGEAEAADTKIAENGEEGIDRASELRKMTYKIEDNTAEIMNYNSIIETSKKSLKEAKKDYEKAKKEYDSKSYSALVYDILTFLGAFFSVYFLIKWLGEKESSLFETLFYVSAALTAFALLVCLYKNFKLRPYRKRMKRAKNLIRDSKTWIEASEREMQGVEDENRSLKKQRKHF